MGTVGGVWQNSMIGKIGGVVATISVIIVFGYSRGLWNQILKEGYKNLHISTIWMIIMPKRLNSNVNMPR